jgi:hypothetical protein
MKIFLILLALLIITSITWIGVIKISKNNLFKDKNNNDIPDVVEEKAKEVKAKIQKVKSKAKQVKEVINKK